MKKSLVALSVALPVLFIAGCSSNTTPAADSSSTSGESSATTSANNAVASDDAAVQAPEGTVVPTPNLSAAPANSSTQSGVKEPVVPPGMSMGSAMVLPTSPELDKQIATLEKGGDKKKLADALAKRGTLRMNDANAAPRVKYRAALVDYKRALTFDPNNAEAKANKLLIEGIYKSMGRPVPQ